MTAGAAPKAAKSRGTGKAGGRRAAAKSGKTAGTAKRRRAKRAPPPMVYEEPQWPAVVDPGKRVFEAVEILDAGPRPASPPARSGWLRREGVRLRCRACGHGNARDAVACGQCRALL